MYAERSCPPEWSGVSINAPLQRADDRSKAAATNS